MAHAHREKRPHSDDQSSEKASSRSSLFSRYWFEMLAVIFFAVGVFLLVERLQIKIIVWKWVVASTKKTAGFIFSTGSWLGNFLDRVEKSDLVGILFITAAFFMVLYGLRARAIARSLSLGDHDPCPKCDGVMHRIHRRILHRLTQGALRVRITRYSCDKCTFQTSIWKNKKQP